MYEYKVKHIWEDVSVYLYQNDITLFTTSRECLSWEKNFFLLDQNVETMAFVLGLKKQNHCVGERWKMIMLN